MGDYDAFGRKVGEDTLDGLGARSPSSDLTPESVETEAVATAPAPTPTPTPEPNSAMSVSSSSGGGPSFDLPDGAQHVARGFSVVARAFVGLITLAVIGTAIYSFDAADSVPDIDFEIPAITIPSLLEPQPETPGERPREARPPAGLQPRSLIRTQQFGKAMALLRSRDLGRITNLRVAADRINVQMLTAGGRLRNLQIDPGDEVRQFSLSGPGFGHLGTIAFTDIDSSAPQRLAREAAGRRGVSPTRIDYLVALEIGGEILWSLFFKDGVQFQADENGRVTRRVPG